MTTSHNEKPTQLPQPHYQHHPIKENTDSPLPGLKTPNYSGVTLRTSHLADILATGVGPTAIRC